MNATVLLSEGQYSGQVDKLVLFYLKKNKAGTFAENHLMLHLAKTITCLILVFCLCSGCGKSDLQARNRYAGKQKHAALPATAWSVTPADYDTALELSGALKDSLDHTLDGLFAATHMPGITVAMLIPGKGAWQRTAGYLSRPQQLRADSTALFYWASVGKFITATIIEQLVLEHKLHYGDKLQQWFPQFEQAKDITIEQLLNHTSGLASFNTDPALFQLRQHYTPDQLMGIALQQKNLFQPGQYWSYSNTGYLLLALIAEKTEQRSFAEIVQSRIALPLGLSSVQALEKQALPGNLALAHDSSGQVVPEDFSVPLGAGNIAANAGDMARLLLGVMSGRLQPASDMAARLADLYPMFDAGMYYGRGIILTDFSELTGDPALWIGHTGGTETYRALLIYDVHTKVFLAVAVNAHIPVEAIARKLLDVVKG